MNNTLVPLEKRHAAAVAELHRQGIDTGFLSSLGPMFLKQLYKAIPSCRAGFGFVCRDAGEVVGFVACAESTSKVYKQSLLRRGPLMAIPLARFMLRPSVIRRMIQTLRYPAEVGGELPAAEILSIVVSAGARGKGVGRDLLGAAMGEFARRGIAQVKVAVGAANDPANRFYRNCGFELAVETLHHGLPMNIYVAQTNSPSVTENLQIPRLY